MNAKRFYPHKLFSNINPTDNKFFKTCNYKFYIIYYCKYLQIIKHYKWIGRSYPCSLWTLFHMISVSLYEKEFYLKNRLSLPEYTFFFYTFK